MSGKAYKRHKDAIGNFNKDYVKTEIFPREMGRKIGEAEEIRHASDYDDFYIASREESERQVAVADEFIQLAEVLEIYATSIDYDPKAESSFCFSNRCRIKCIGRLISILQQK